MAQRDPGKGDEDAMSESDRYVAKNWPFLLIACCVLILWYTLGNNAWAGAAGFMGIGWLAWSRLIKPRL